MWYSPMGSSNSPSQSGGWLFLWRWPVAQMWLADLGKRRANLEERDAVVTFPVAHGTLLTRRFVTLESLHFWLRHFRKSYSLHSDSWSGSASSNHGTSLQSYQTALARATSARGWQMLEATKQARTRMKSGSRPLQVPSLGSEKVRNAMGHPAHSESPYASNAIRGIPAACTTSCFVMRSPP